MADFLKSSKVKVFPSAFRKTVTANGTTTANDPESHLNTERNLTNIAKRVTDRASFVIDYDAGADIMHTSIGGYWFELNELKSSGGPYVSGSPLWAAIKVSTIASGGENNPILLNISSDGTALDPMNLDNDDGEFRGIKFFTSEPSDFDLRLQLFDKDGNIPGNSRWKLDSCSVYNAVQSADGTSSDASISDSFSTAKLTVSESATVRGDSTVVQVVPTSDTYNTALTLSPDKIVLENKKKTCPRKIILNVPKDSDETSWYNSEHYLDISSWDSYYTATAKHVYVDPDISLSINRNGTNVVKLSATNHSSVGTSNFRDGGGNILVRDTKSNDDDNVYYSATDISPASVTLIARDPTLTTLGRAKGKISLNADYDGSTAPLVSITDTAGNTEQSDGNTITVEAANTTAGATMALLGKNGNTEAFKLNTNTGSLYLKNGNSSIGLNSYSASGDSWIEVVGNPTGAGFTTSLSYLHKGDLTLKYNNADKFTLTGSTGGATFAGDCSAGSFIVEGISGENAFSTTAGNFSTTTGTMTAQSFNATSDRRLKENIVDYVCEKSILDLPVKKFDFIEGRKNQIGCIAQDLQEICPEIVSEGSDGYLAIQESKIVYLLLQEVKKLRKEVDELKGGK